MEEHPTTSTSSTTTTHGRDITYRLLCSSTTSGAVTGTIVKHLEKQTGVKIHTEHSEAHSNDRIITVTGPQSPKKTITFNKEHKHQVSPVQLGLIRVLERVWEVEAELLPNVKKRLVTCRMLANKSQIGSVMGKGGQRIATMQYDTKARVRVLADVPACVPRYREVVQITGVSLAVKRATLAVSQCLQDVPPFEKTQTPGVKTFTLPPDKSSLPHRMNGPIDCASRSYLVPGEEEVVFRLLCSNDRIGGVIGKNADIVKALEDETGASIRAAEPVADSDDRVIHISAMENPGSKYSPAQNAVICVFKRSTAAGNGRKLVSGASKDPVVEARLLISLDQAGCLIGVGGTSISEFRKITHTSMWILKDDEVPPCAAAYDEVLKIEGPARNVQDALFIVTGKLRNTIFCNNMVNIAGRMKEPIAAGSYPPLDRFTKSGQRATLTEGMHRLGLSHTMDHSVSPDPRKSEIHGDNTRGVIDTGRGAADPIGGLGYGSGRRSAAMMNTILEISVPEYVLGSVNEEKESNLILSRLRQISGAKVCVRDFIPGSDETTLIISGTPDQTQAAQSVLQALIFGCGNS